jgi:hypothetical protein
MSAKKSDELSDKEAAKHRDEIVRRMITTPPKPFKPKPKKARNAGKRKLSSIAT